MLTPDQARQWADSWLDDVANGTPVDEAMNVYQLIDDSDDYLQIGRHLAEPLTGAINAYLAGDRSASVVNLTAVARRIDG